MKIKTTTQRKRNEKLLKSLYYRRRSTISRLRAENFYESYYLLFIGIVVVVVETQSDENISGKFPWLAETFIVLHYVEADWLLGRCCLVVVVVVVVLGRFCLTVVVTVRVVVPPWRSPDTSRRGWIVLPADEAGRSLQPSQDSAQGGQRRSEEEKEEEDMPEKNQQGFFLWLGIQQVCTRSRIISNRKKSISYISGANALWGDNKKKTGK